MKYQDLPAWSSSAAPLLVEHEPLTANQEKCYLPPHCHSPLPGPATAPRSQKPVAPRFTTGIFLLCSFVTLVIVFFNMIVVSPCTETTKSKCYRGYNSDWSFDGKSPSNTNWMSRIPDLVNLTAVSLPGTHDTMTFTVPDIKLQCQNNNLSTQLAAGIRYIDARTRLNGDKLSIYHAYQATGHTLSQVLTTVFTFLEAHPTETIIVRIKEEGPRLGNSTLTFEQAFNNLQHHDLDLAWHFTQRLYIPLPFAPLPTMKQMRGKALILQEFPAITDYGIRWKSTQITLEDLWIIPSLPHLELKWTSIRDALVRSAAAPADENEVLYVSHLSASVGVLPIEAAAGSRDGVFMGMNDRTGVWLESQEKGRRGVVIMDFPGQPLIDAVIGQNEPLFEEKARL